MTHLRDRLRASDPAHGARPLDPDELAAMRRAMLAVVPSPRRWPLVVSLAVIATSMLLAALLWPDAPVPVAVPARPSAILPSLPVSEVPPGPAPAVAVTEVRPAPRRVVRPQAPAQVKEIRFVTASGTQILWTFRSSEEGA